MATLALSVIGASIGSAIGGTFLGMSAASLGWSVGSMVGNMLFAPEGPNVNQEGPRLGDLKIISSTYGNSIPRVYGGMRISGNVIWSEDILETRTTSTQSGGGKGGGGGGSVTTTTYSYSQSFAVALCEGEIAGVRKIWANGKLIYNLSDTADVSTVAASGTVAAGITVYTGSEAQTANSLIEANVGAGQAPAYRGTAYVVFDTLQLADYGNRTPNLEFEVIAAGSDADAIFYSERTFPSALSWVGAAYGNGRYVAITQGDAYVPANYGFTAVSFDGQTWTQNTNNLPYAAYGIYYFGGQFWAAASTGIYYSADGISWTLATAYGVTSLCHDGTNFYGTNFGANTVVTSDGETWSLQTLPNVPGRPTPGWYSCASLNGTTVLIENAGGAAVAKVGGGSWQVITAPSGHIAAGNGIFMIAATSGDVYTSPDGITFTFRSSQGLAPYEIEYGGGKFAIVGNSSSFGKMVVTNDNGATFASAVPSYGYYDSLAFDGSLFFAARGAGSIVCFFTNGDAVTMGNTSLASIVSDICIRTENLTAGDIDVTGLTGSVHGYVVQRSSARSHLQPLMQAYYFDAVESNGKVKFVHRGGASVVTIDEEELAAHEYGSDEMNALSIRRMQDMELPLEISIQYLDTSAAYQINAQTSMRQVTNSNNKVSNNLAIAMTATKAKEIADVTMYDAWASRTDVNFSSCWKYGYLEPTDIVTLTAGGRSYIVRITNENASAGIYERTAVLEDSNAYTQTAVAAEATAASETVAIIGQTNLKLLDIPLLRDQDDGVGFYSAAAGYNDGWRGAQLYKSTDNGASWLVAGTGFLNEATIGWATTALGNFTQNIFDETNSVTVTLSSGELSSDTEINVLNGSNVAILGGELIQFRDATLISANTYKLTGLLRGRNGTEWARSMHAANETFVLLTDTTTYLQIGPSSEYDIARLYRAGTFGGLLDNAANVSFTNTAVALMPYAPVHVGGGRNAAGDLTLNWTRRSRIAGSWNAYADVPLGETTEAYEVEIYSSNAYSTVLRTITGITSATTSYTAAQQTSDFGSPQATVYFIVYQMSSVVGRGYEARGVA